MSSLTIRFEGICTHITYPYPPAPDCPHRVVMLRAWEPYREHIARLIIPTTAASETAVKKFAVVPYLEYERELEGNYHLRLNGVELSVRNGTGPYEQQQTFLCCIPRLSGLMRNWLGEPDLGVTNGRLPIEAWAYFNIAVGTLSAGLVHQGASAAVLDCETTEAPVLVASGFSPLEPPPSELRLEAGSTLTIQNVAENDAEDDFGIHYRVVRPPRPTLPKGPTSTAPCLKPLSQPEPPPPRQSIGPGCSNSIFP
jgi:hypothetical protein